MKMTKTQIEQAATNYFTYHRGLMYFNQGRVKECNASAYEGGVTIQSEVQGTKRYQVEVTLQDNNILEFHCECEAHTSYEGACKHVVATLLTYLTMSQPVAKKRREVGTTKEDRLFQGLLSAYERRHITDPVVIMKQRRVDLIPFIGFNDRSLNLRFMIGHDRHYMIKNIRDFYNNLLYRKEVQYGKQLTLTHHIDAFTRESQGLVRFILDYYQESDQRRSYYDDKRFFNLENTQIDALFDLYIGKSIQYESEEGSLSFASNDLEMTLVLEEIDSKHVRLSLKQPIDELIKTDLYSYLLINHTLYRIPPQMNNQLKPLIEVFSQRDHMTLRNEDVQAFFLNIIPEVKEYIKVEMEESIRNSHQPIPLSAKLYLDIPKFNRVIADLKFFYGEQEVEPLEPLTESMVIRNLREEAQVFGLMNSYFEFNEEDKVFFVSDEDAMYRLYSEGIKELNEHLEVYATEEFNRRIRKTPVIQVGVRLNHHTLDLTITAEDLPLNELYDILTSYKKRKKFHRLKDGTFITIDEEMLEEFEQVVDGLNLSKKDLEMSELQVPKYRAFYLDQIRKQSRKMELQEDEGIKGMVNALGGLDLDIPVPKTFKGELRSYQRVGLNWLHMLSNYGLGGVLADDMGLGKTIQVISFIASYLEHEQEPLPSLIVCPASLVLNWEHEFGQFAPSINVLPIIGSMQERKELIEQIKNYPVIITSYDYLKRDIDHYEGFTFMYHVIDEAQYIKNHQTQNAQSVKKVNSHIRFALTGTPIENSLAEIWSIFDFILPGYLFNYNRFSTHYEKPIVKDEDRNATKRLKQLVKPFVLRRLKRDVLKELPDKMETVVYVKLEDEQKKLYQASLALIRQDLKKQIEEAGVNSSRILILSMLTRLRQLCCHPSLYYDDYEGSSAKLEASIELIQNSIASGHKILLFSQFTSMLEILRRELEKQDISYYVLEGSTKKEDRKALVDQFNEDDTKVFLISLKAGGTGLNLTSADVVIHYDPWWNVSAQNQATDRSHRIGQTETVNVYKLIAKDTIEEKILKLQEAKQKLSDEVIVSDDGVITRMSQAEILKLFEEE